jgi:cytochrome c
MLTLPSLTRLLAITTSLTAVCLNPASAADAVHGEAVFKRCAACHSLKPGENKVGPSLFGGMGKKAGSVDGYRYSDALKNSGLVWDEATLDSFLAAPAKKVPGTKMAVGVPNATDRADLIAYLATQK